MFDTITVYFSEWLDLAAKVPITNLYFMPDTLEKLVSYDAFIKFSDIVNQNNLIDQAKLDICLKVLGVNCSDPITVSTQLNLREETFGENRIENDLVSIIIPTYNRENYLQEAIESVLKQTCKNIELIIVDDGSTDNTKSIAEKYLSDNRVKYIYQQNKVFAPRNSGILMARGKYLMFLDDDDLYLPYAVEKMLTVIKNSRKM